MAERPPKGARRYAKARFEPIDLGWDWLRRWPDECESARQVFVLMTGLLAKDDAALTEAVRGISADDHGRAVLDFLDCLEGQRERHQALLETMDSTLARFAVAMARVSYGLDREGRRAGSTAVSVAGEAPAGVQPARERLDDEIARMAGLGCAVMIVGLAVDHAPGSECFPVGKALETLGAAIRDAGERAEAAYEELLREGVGKR